MLNLLASTEPAEPAPSITYDAVFVGTDDDIVLWLSVVIGVVVGVVMGGENLSLSTMVFMVGLLVELMVLGTFLITLNR